MIDGSLSVDSLPFERWMPKVGDRVRVRISGECGVQGGSLSPISKAGVTAHFPDEDGATGTVYDPFLVHPAKSVEMLMAQGHTVFVRLDQEIPAPGSYFGSVNASAYALSEVEPLEWDR